MSTLFESQGCFLASGKKKHPVTDHMMLRALKRIVPLKHLKFSILMSQHQKTSSYPPLKRKKDEHLLSRLAFINV